MTAPTVPQLGDRVAYSDDDVLPPDPVGIVVESTEDEVERIRAHPDCGYGPDYGDVLVDWPEPHGRAWEHPTGVRVLAPTSRWWVGWYSAGTFEYHGPWWVTGNEVPAPRRATFCAAVQADDEDAARRVIVDAHDDDPAAVIEWRFIEQQAADWAPFAARFPRATWMRWSR